MEKVSIIMPAYNCEKFIKMAIDSVKKQTYSNWELLIVDDCSNDSTFDIVTNLAKTENRIICLKNEKNMGAAASRNKAVKAATGRYLAFLDSDDVWFEEKLEKQINFMIKNNYAFTCTSYNKINEEGADLQRNISALNVDYCGLLKRCPGNSTVIYDAQKLGKHEIPLIKKRNDYVMWLQVIKKAERLHGLNEVLSSHRVGMQSISSNKFSLVEYHWVVYRNIEQLSWIRSVYLVWFWILKSVFKIK